MPTPTNRSLLSGLRCQFRCNGKPGDVQVVNDLGPPHLYLHGGATWNPAGGIDFDGTGWLDLFDPGGAQDPGPFQDFLSVRPGMGVTVVVRAKILNLANNPRLIGRPGEWLLLAGSDANLYMIVYGPTGATPHQTIAAGLDQVSSHFLLGQYDRTNVQAQMDAGALAVQAAYSGDVAAGSNSSNSLQVAREYDGVNPAAHYLVGTITGIAVWTRHA
jgi:hypothetical protein